MTSRLIEAGCGDVFDDASELEPFIDIQWRSVLLSLDATQSYNQVVQGAVSQEAVLEFLVHNHQLPRSLAYSLASLRNSVRDLPRNEKVLRAVNRLRRQVDAVDFEGMEIKAIETFLDDFQSELAAIDQSVNRTYFQYKPRRRRKS
jgi:uncharacterized alpha-E superfamily protein